MLDGAIEAYLSHPELMIGVHPEPETLKLESGAAAVASSTQILLRVRAQIAPVRVAFWSQVGIKAGTLVVDAVLEFPTTFVHVFDTDKTVFYSRRIGGPGRHRVCVFVDDPGAASRVHLAIDASPRVGTSGAAAGIGSVRLSDGDDAGSELEFWLAEYDRPLQRLSRAIACVARRAAVDRGLFTYDIRQLVEWVRWLTPSLSLEEAQAMGILLRDGIRDFEKPVTAFQIDALAGNVMDRISADL
ncbi:hypothetical protein GCM10009827_012260 [Dactylosporangium maewongense]|uniref:Uncharacterized protein n=1 Tax=Dactylosporangium maewongense TaxID=634393 RepID=A0ABP4KJ77_9ACTN